MFWILKMFPKETFFWKYETNKFDIAPSYDMVVILEGISLKNNFANHCFWAS